VRDVETTWQTDTKHSGNQLRNGFIQIFVGFFYSVTAGIPRVEKAHSRAIFR